MKDAFKAISPLFSSCCLESQRGNYLRLRCELLLETGVTSRSVTSLAITAELYEKKISTFTANALKAPFLWPFQWKGDKTHRLGFKVYPNKKLQ